MKMSTIEILQFIFSVPQKTGLYQRESAVNDDRILIW